MTTDALSSSPAAHDDDDGDGGGVNSSSSSSSSSLLASQIEERLIHQEYKIWKKNTPYLYDFVMTHGLEWPSLTCQWLPTRRTLADGNRIGALGGNSANCAEQHELLLGTHTSSSSSSSSSSSGNDNPGGDDAGGAGGNANDGGGGGNRGGSEMNYLMVATVNLPRDDVVVVVPCGGGEGEGGEGEGEDAGANKRIKAAVGGPSPKSVIVDAPMPASNYNEEKDELGGHHANSAGGAAAATVPSSSAVSSLGQQQQQQPQPQPRVGKIEIRMRIPHEGEVNRARYMPQNRFVVASRGPGPDVYVWDLSKHSSGLASSSLSSSSSSGEGVASSSSSSTHSTSTSTIVPNPNVICRGHAGEGYGMAWCPMMGDDGYGKLATCAEDRTVRLWNVRDALSSNNGAAAGCGGVGGSGGGGGGGGGTAVVSPYATYEYHTDVVEDVDWHNRDINMIGSCGDDGLVCLWDVRRDPTASPLHVVRNAHDGDVNGMEFHPINEFLLATCGSDRAVKLWDMRNLKSPLQTLEGHTDQVFAVHWSPFDESILASCSADRRIALWDLSRIGAEQSAEDAEDGPPELLFLHGGHTSRVNDFSWNPNYEWCIGGVSEDNVMQVWCPAEDVYAEDDDDDDDDEDVGKDPSMIQRAEILGDDELE